MSPVDNPFDLTSNHETETATPMPFDDPSERARPASSYIVLPHEGRAPDSGRNRVPEGGIYLKDIPTGTRCPERPQDPPHNPGRVPGCVPPLWPGHDPEADNGVCAAWRDLWHKLADGPMHWAEVLHELTEDHPQLQRKTLDGIMRKAITNGHLAKRGGYSHKTRRDTRTIERRTAPEAP